MGVQKIIKQLLLISIGWYCLASCNPKPQQLRSNNTCLDEIHVAVSDSILLYWAEIAADSTHLIEHAGNSRFLISQSGRVYVSYNNKGIENLDNYFNTDLKYFKTLSSNKLKGVKDSIIEWKLSTLEPVVINKGIRTSGGAIDSYLYTNNNQKVSCNQFGMGVSLVKRIKKELKNI